MEFNSENFKKFRADVLAALEAVGEKHGLAIDTGRISYGEFDFKMPLECTKQSIGFNGEFEKFKVDCYLYDFKPEHYKKEFNIGKDTFVLTGFNLRSPKNNCSITKISTGEQYKANDKTVKRAMGIS